jgi:CubicO group peptidase (beta-lactamase class C family)
MVTVTGTAEPDFAELADVFGRAVAARPGAGAALTVFQDGRRVAELQAGDYPTGARQLLFSVSKLVVAIALHAAADAGELDLDEPLSASWAAFRRPDTNAITLRDVLAHRSGFSRFAAPVELADILAGRDAELVAAQQPDRSSGHAYHALSFGSLVTGALRARGADSPARLIARFVAEPLGVGLELGEGRSGRPVPVRFEAPVESVDAVTPRPIAAVDHGLVALLADPEVFNSDEFRAAEISAMGVVGSATDLATILAATLPGSSIRVLSDDARRTMTAPQVSGIDGSLGVVTAFGSGVQLPFPRLPLTSALAYGHEGAGGCVAFADPGLGLAVGYTTDLFPPAPGACPAFAASAAALRLLAERSRRATGR